MIPYSILIVKKTIKKGGSFDETGQTLVEYALIIAFVAILLVVALSLLGVDLQGYYEYVSEQFPNPYP